VCASPPYVSDASHYTSRYNLRTVTRTSNIHSGSMCMPLPLNKFAATSFQLSTTHLPPPLLVSHYAHLPHPTTLFALRMIICSHHDRAWNQWTNNFYLSMAFVSGIWNVQRASTSVQDTRGAEAVLHVLDMFAMHGARHPKGIGRLT
jgi:hypothetical protein